MTRISVALLALLLAGAGGYAVSDDHRGGTIELLAHAPAGSIDPQINYTGQFWQFFAFTYDGLLATRKAGGPAGLEIVADLADAVPVAEEGGRLYRFHLRDGVRFSNGAPARPRDVAASFRRLFRIAGPTAGGFYAGIVGADRCLAHAETCVLEGVTADDARGTIDIRLTAPDPEFPIKLTLPPASVLPESAPAHDAGTTPLPGTGAYRLIAYDPGRALVAERNLYFRMWSADAQPDGYPDRIRESFGLEDEAEITQVENGQADWLFDPPPADRLAEISVNPAIGVHLNAALAIWYVALNTRLPPFDNPHVRQAVDLAIDRDALVKLYGGHRMASPACQMLPPGLPGYVRYCPYPHDVARARNLVRASGTAGQKVTLITGGGPVQRAIGGYLQSVLGDLGYDASVRALSGDVEFTYIQNSNNRVQAALTDWFADYPAPSDFLRVLFACDAFHPGSDSSLNIAQFCDPALDARMAAAGQDAAAWQAIDHAIADQAPTIPLFVPRYIDIVSKRIGHFVYNDQYHWLISQSWAH